MQYGPVTQEQYIEHGGSVASIEDVAKYESYCAASEAEDEAYRKAGNRAICPECGERTYRDRAIRTMQYGGGWDTYYWCESCGHGDVAV